MSRFVFTVFVFSFLFTQIDLKAQHNIGNADLNLLGQMYPIENFPYEKFKEEYGIPDSMTWTQKLQRSVVKFNKGCTATFVSEQGLLLTAQHCSYKKSIDMQNSGERFDLDGFLAKDRDRERKANNIKVSQLWMTKEITAEILNTIAKEECTIDIAINKIKNNYQNKQEWKDLDVQVFSYFNNQEFSIHGYKIYEDVRLVFLPQGPIRVDSSSSDQGLFDFAFWRVYDNGVPLNTESLFLKINTTETELSEPVFMSGYPGKTKRFYSSSQLQYIADIDLAFDLEGSAARKIALNKKIKTPPRQEQGLIKQQQKKQLNIMQSLSEISQKTDISDNLTNNITISYLQETEDNLIKSIPSAKDVFMELESIFEERKKYAPTFFQLSAKGKNWTNIFIHGLYTYYSKVKQTENIETLTNLKQKTYSTSQSIQSGSGIKKIKKTLEFLKSNSPEEDSVLVNILEGQNIESYIKNLTETTAFTSYENSMALLNNRSKVVNAEDPLLKLAKYISPKFLELKAKYESSQHKIDSLNQILLDHYYAEYRPNIYPKSNATLRISDGYIMGYNLKGIDEAKATTFSDLNEFAYFDDFKKEEWESLLSSHKNSLVYISSSTDGTKGNSGSPLTNINNEIVGIVYKSGINASSINDYIYDANLRAVSVQSQAIYLILKHIYSAEELITEIMQ